MLRKKILTLASTSVLATALTVAAFAGGPSMEPMQTSESGFTLGLNYATQLDNNFVLMAGYVNDNFLADFGANYNQFSYGTNINRDAWELRADLGLRNQLVDTVYLTYGANGADDVLENKPSATKMPYAVGAFVGLDYQPMNHLLLSLKVDPYMYVSHPTNDTGGFTTANEVFANGSIGASYIFA